MTCSVLEESCVRVIDTIMACAHAEGRGMLFEHEVYAVLTTLGLRVPIHHLVCDVEEITPELLSRFPSAKIVLKAAAADIAHKQKAGAIHIAVKDLEFIRYSFRRMQTALLAAGHALKGILLVEFIDYSQDLGNEILLGFRESDAFGPVISFSKGGSDAEHFAEHFSSPNLILAPIDRKWAEALLYSTHIQKKYLAQGHLDFTDKIIGAGLIFSDLAVNFSNFFDSGSQFVFKEFEVNPFIFDSHGRFMALDGYAVFEPRRRPTASLAIQPVESLRPIFNPQGVAVFGISTRNPNAPGSIIARNLMALGRTDVYCINPKADRIDLGGRRYPVYARIEDVPGPIELAVVSIPADHVLDVVRDCARKGVKGIILISGGFSETGRGESTEKLILEVARSHGIRLLGPNCLGVLYSGDGQEKGIHTFFVPEEKMQLPPGQNKRVALLSQSGALGITELHNLRHGISPHAIVSYGNQLDIDPSDLIAYFGQNEAIDVIGCYIEGFKPGAGAIFYDQARRCPKPVIIYKAGRTKAGRKATESHTASIAGEYAVARAAMKQAGLVVAESMMEHKDLIKTFALFNDFPVNGNRVAVIANAGYEKTYAADHLDNLEVATLDDATTRALGQILPPYVTVDPLLDLTPMADDALFERCIDSMLQCAGVDALLISIVPQTPALHTTDEEMRADADNVAVRIVRQMRAHRKPVMVSICITAGADVVYNRFGQTLEKGGVPTFLFASHAMSCLNAFIRYRMNRSTENYAQWLI